MSHTKQFSIPTKRTQTRRRFSLMACLCGLLVVFGIGSVANLGAYYVCALNPWATDVLTQNFSVETNTVFNKEELNTLAQSTRSYVFNNHDIVPLEQSIQDANKKAFERNPQDYFKFLGKELASNNGFVLAPQSGPDTLKVVTEEEFKSQQKTQIKLKDLPQDVAQFVKEKIQTTNPEAIKSGQNGSGDVVEIDPSKLGSEALDALNTAGLENVLSNVSIPQQENYRLSDNAISHLDDVSTLSTQYVFMSLFICALGLIAALYLGLIRGGNSLAKALSRGGALTFICSLCIAALLLLGFNTGFEIFHQILFPQGNYSFPLGSLIISIFPPLFWMGMFGIWLGTSALIGLIFFIAGSILKRIYR